jgi:hypothetical protein
MWPCFMQQRHMELLVPFPRTQVLRETPIGRTCCVFCAISCRKKHLSPRRIFSDVGRACHGGSAVYYACEPAFRKKRATLETGAETLVCLHVKLEHAASQCWGHEVRLAAAEWPAARAALLGLHSPSSAAYCRALSAAT